MDYGAAVWIMELSYHGRHPSFSYEGKMCKCPELGSILRQQGSVCKEAEIELHCFTIFMRVRKIAKNDH